MQAVGEGVGLEVQVLRGGRVESVHAVDVCVTAPDGSVLAASDGEAAARPVFPRSAAKPFQALPSVAAEVLGRLGLDDRHLAVACASHAGTDAHVALVREVLAAVDLPEAALACGVTPPLDAEVAARLTARGEAVGPARHNCSGNHALGLALCVLEGWDVPSYLDPAHPLQAAMRRAVHDAAGADAVVDDEGVDGCGMPAYRLSLSALAAAYGRLASGRLGPAGDRVAAAMTTHPDLVHGAAGVDSALMAAAPGLVAKVGAEGVLGVGLPDGRGLALKVRDGSWRALDPAAVLAVRAALGVAPEDARLTALAAPALRNGRGEVVGAVVAAPLPSRA